MDSDKLIERIMDTMDEMNGKITTIVTDIAELKSGIKERDAAMKALQVQVDEVASSVKVSGATWVKLTAIVCGTAIAILGVRYEGVVEAIKKLILSYWSM